nr:ATP synthase F0 subunit 8 [Arma chinensis]QZP40910.1 ATP synthase F0 subunit 8 [Arma chinensis]URT60178.1 ATP synthase F0 subunit 8 [Arma chinensis]
MSPLWWELLFITFVMTYFLFNIMIYFNKKNMLISKNLKNNKIINLTWMW